MPSRARPLSPQAAPMPRQPTRCAIGALGLARRARAGCAAAAPRSAPPAALGTSPSITATSEISAARAGAGKARDQANGGFRPGSGPLFASRSLGAFRKGLAQGVADSCERRLDFGKCAGIGGRAHPVWPAPSTAASISTKSSAPILALIDFRAWAARCGSQWRRPACATATSFSSAGGACSKYSPNYAREKGTALPGPPISRNCPITSGSSNADEVASSLCRDGWTGGTVVSSTDAAAFATTGDSGSSLAGSASVETGVR